MSRGTDDLISQYIEPGPDTTGPADARIVNAGVPVWALIGYLQANDDDTAAAAADYDLPPEAVEAARAYYQRHRAVIDARLRLHASFFTSAV
jgi:uncharacterized protein (DUF433 family)